jgi:nitrogenase subunit NifH
LSPCILLTRNHRDFGPLDVKIPSQGVDAVFAAINVEVGETRVQAVVMLPATPVVAVGATTNWAADKVGPMAWFVLALLVVGGVVMYRRQPQERKERIKTFASSAGQFLLDEYTRAACAVQQAEDQLGAFVVRGPDERSVTSAVFRKLAMADDSLSAQQICNVLDDSVRPAVDPLRRFLHSNRTTVFREVRRGGFVLGGRYHVRQAIQA